MKINILYPFLVLVFLFSCKPQKDLNYMQDMEQQATQVAYTMEKTTLQPNDQLVITVMAKDMDVVKPFNQNYSSGRTLQNAQLSGNISNVSQTATGPTYVVDSQGFVDFPVLGKLDTNGQTIDAFKENLQNRLTRYIKNPTVSVKLNNFKVSVMGEVNRPGLYVLADGKGTIMEALSMAGDLSIYGVRDQILLIRSVDGKMEKVKLDITKSDFIDTPYYALRQGDVIYVPANKTKQKTSRVEPNAGIYISVASIVVTILALIFRR